jgi:mannose-6-phosphate isomerase
MQPVLKNLPLSSKPLKFNPLLKTVIWGGKDIRPFKGLEANDETIGESWEISGVPGDESVVSEGEFKGYNLAEMFERYGAELVGAKAMEVSPKRFPLLIKIIDACNDLSVQVHPDDKLANARHNSPGKTEMWYIVKTKPNAKIYCGLKSKLTPESYERAVADNSIMDSIAAHDSKPGVTFFIPAGRIHAIGAGNFLVEVQQTSDITYRIYDYNRRDSQGNARELHTQLAKDAIDYTVYDSYTTEMEDNGEALTKLVKCRYFDVNRLTIKGEEWAKDMSASDTFVTMTCIEGSAEIVVDGDKSSIKQGESILIPAIAKSLSVKGNASFITAEITAEITE